MGTTEDPQHNALLSRKISDLALRIQGTRLDALVAQLYDELERAGIGFHPPVYLADEWGCPDDVPVIGIPFYLADPQLARLEGDLTGVEAESEAEVMMYLRHEAGHAFNYAYHLYEQPEWKQLFGSMDEPYSDEFKPVPFSQRFVRHVPGWYAQKHPDEDFAETFAVWLTPDSRWREHYAGTPALQKLEYVDRTARLYGSQPPLVTDATPDTPADTLDVTLREWYHADDNEGRTCPLPRLLDEDLRALFPVGAGQPAADAIRAHRVQLIFEVNRWTGINRSVLGVLLDELVRRVEALALHVETEQINARMLSLAVFLTTLAMNYHYTDAFVES